MLSTKNLMKYVNLVFLSAVCVSAFEPAQVSACGGFFCGQTPVDQSAERIVFTIDEVRKETTMTAQITYSGEADDFAWILPIAGLPDGDRFQTFSQTTMVTLDGVTAPRFVSRSFCRGVNFDAAPESAQDDGGVDVLVEAIVDNYAAVVISAEGVDGADERARVLVTWLRDNQYQITDVMVPYIRLYAQNQSMKFLALRLIEGSSVNDIKPFQFTMPGTLPSIPIRMTSIAAEPDMGIAVWIFANTRYKPQNWSELRINPEEIVRDPFTFQTNWLSLVSRKNDEVGGTGFVTEMAGDADFVREQLMNSLPFLPEPQDGEELSPEEVEARMEREQDLADIAAMIPEGAFMTRLYTRLSAEEMKLDPIFAPWDGNEAEKVVSQIWEFGLEEDCGFDRPDPVDPCEFVSCGAGGECQIVSMDEGGQPVVGCACVPGATARAVRAPGGGANRFVAPCQDMRMSFLNPGDVQFGENNFVRVLTDPCVGFECGENGACETVNMTPTCVCDEGFVAVARADENGEAMIRCDVPSSKISNNFYNKRLPELGADMPAGRNVEVPDPDPISSGGSCSLTVANTGNHFSVLGLIAFFGFLVFGTRVRRQK